MKKIITKIALAILLMLPLGAALPALAAPAPYWNATGNYVVTFNDLGNNYDHDMTLAQDGSGNLTGNGGYPAGLPHVYTWVLTSGSVSGNTIEFYADYTATADAVTPQTTMHVLGAIALDGTMSGTWSDNYQAGTRTGTWTTKSGAAVSLGSLTAQDFGVMDVSGVKGYTAGFGLTDATLVEVQSAVTELYSGSTLLQTDTSIPAISPKLGVDYPAMIQFSSPFDVFGSFDYVADGYWSNARGSEYGQTMVPTKVVATVTLLNGKVVTAENTNLTGDLTVLFPLTTPVITTPANGATVQTSALVKVDWTDAVGLNSPFMYQYEAFSDAAYTSLIYDSGMTLSVSEIPTLGTPPGDYYLRVRAQDSTAALSGWSNGSGNEYKISVIADQPLPGTLSAEDFGVVNYDTGLGIIKGYTAGFGVADATFAGATSVVVKLYAAGDVLLQTNTAILPKFNADITGTQFSSPFDVSGAFDYATDGYWTNVKEPQYGQSVPAVKVVATVTLANGKIVTAENTNLTGDPATIFPATTGSLTVDKITVGTNGTFTFASDIPGNSSFGITTTNNAGSQTFDNLVPGVYHVTENMAKGWTMTENECASITIAAGANVTCTVTNTNSKLLGQIRGTKLEDKDGDGKLNDGFNRRLSGWTMYIDANNDGALDSGEPSTVTDKHGNYRFSNLVAGTYIVREVNQAGWIQTYPSSGSYTIALAAGKISKKDDFGNFKLGTISGMKFNDANGNRRKDNGELGLQDWTINLMKAGSSTVVASTVTDANGNYSFINLNPGTYQIREVQQTGWVQTTNNPANVKVYSGSISKIITLGTTLAR